MAILGSGPSRSRADLLCGQTAQGAPRVTSTPRKGSDLRRTDRDEGMKLLYGAALDVARQEGKIPEGLSPSFEKSALERGRYKLRSADDRLLAAVTLHDAREMLAYRRELARQVLEKSNVSVNSENPGAFEKRQIRIQKPEVRAIAWAISTGRRVPMPPKRRFETLKAIGLLICGIVPGLLYIRRGLQRRTAYQADLDGLVERWRMASKPDPADSFFALYHL